MRGVSLEATRRIRAPVQRVWHLLSRLESQPRYATLWLAADVLERSPGTALVEFRGFFGGLPLTSVQRFTLKAPGRMEFRQVRGELRDLTGAYVLKDAEGDTDLTLQVAVDAGIPLFSDESVQQILASFLDGTLSRIKAAAERDLVRLIPRRARLTETPSPGSDSPGPAAVAEGVEGADEDEAEAEKVTAPEETPATPAASAPPRKGRRGRGRRRRRGRHGGAVGAPPTGPRPSPT